MGLSYGEMSSVELNGGGESLRLSLVVARAHTRDFGRILAWLESRRDLLDVGRLAGAVIAAVAW